MLGKRCIINMHVSVLLCFSNKINISLKKTGNKMPLGELGESKKNFRITADRIQRSRFYKPTDTVYESGIQEALVVKHGEWSQSPC